MPRLTVTTVPLIIEVAIRAVPAANGARLRSRDRGHPRGCSDKPGPLLGAKSLSHPLEDIRGGGRGALRGAKLRIYKSSDVLSVAVRRLRGLTVRQGWLVAEAKHGIAPRASWARQAEQE